MLALQKDKLYTYSDYITWDGQNRYELIDGVPHMMSPAPSRAHQEISRELSYQLTAFLKGKPCKVFAAPFDVRLNADEYDNTVVQPDILVVCDKSKLDDHGCRGVPDLIIEILSPSSNKHDRITKFNAYLKAGVREYWIIDPFDKIVSVYILKDGQYMTYAYGETDDLPVYVLSGCQINLGDVFSY